MNDQISSEEWRLVVGYPNYRVSNMGNIESNFKVGTRGKSTGAWNRLNPMIGKVGYPHVFITNGTRKSAYVHALVLESFVGPRPAGYVACHNNGKRDDCRLENLRWDTYKANEKDKIRHGKSNRAGARLTAEQVLEIKAHLASGKLRQCDIAKLFGATPAMICDIKKGRTYLSVNWSPMAVMVAEYYGVEVAG